MGPARDYRLIHVICVPFVKSRQEVFLKNHHFNKKVIKIMIDTLAPSKTNIISAIQKNRNKIKAFGVKKLGLFGSVVRGEQRLDSDIDLLVEFQPEQKTFDNFIQLSFFFRGYA